MMLETFFEKFDQFADAPEAVERVRGLVKELAIQGRLAPQNSAEENAADVLAAISLERTKRSIDLRLPVKQMVASDVRQQFRIPDNWFWVNLANVALQIQYGYTASADSTATEIRMLRITDIQNGNVDWPSVPGCQIENGEAEKFRLYPNDILIARTGGTIGKSFIVPDAPVKSVFASYLIRITPPQSLVARYLKVFLESPLYWTQLREMSAGTGQPNVNGQALGRLELPLPPFAEQKRIVAKVDELMALCDRLDAQQRERNVRQVALSRAAIARFDGAATPASLNFLFHSSYSIAPSVLRKTILNLAVRGKLVPQDPNEEAAKTTLERLGLRCADDLEIGEISEDSAIPESWSRVRFENVAVIAGGVTLGRKLGNQKTVTLPYLRVANVKRGEIDVGEMKQIAIAEDETDRYALAEGDVLLTEGGDWDKVGRAAIWDGRISPCLHQNHIFRARMRSPEIAPYWFERYFNSPQGRAYFEGASKQTTNLASINMRQVRACPIPFPPIAEQNRIILKLDQLMALVDQLETQLAASDATARKLLDAVIHELLHPSADAVEFPLASRDLASDRAAIGCYAIQHLAQSPNFGRTMLMKICYLSQAHLGVSQDWQPMRQAAGPWDPWIEDFESLGKRSDWFNVAGKNLNNGHTKIEYHAKAGLKAKAAEAITLLGDQRAEFDRLLNLFADKSTEETEIIATLFAAWNDFLIDGKSPSDDEIIREVRENWHSKKERFAPARLAQWLRWLREHKLIPVGNPPRTRQQLSLALV